MAVRRVGDEHHIAARLLERGKTYTGAAFALVHFGEGVCHDDVAVSRTWREIVGPCFRNSGFKCGPWGTRVYGDRLPPTIDERIDLEVEAGHFRGLFNVLPKKVPLDAAHTAQVHGFAIPTGSRHPVYRADRLEGCHPGQECLGPTSKAQQPVRHDRAESDLVVAFRDLRIDVEVSAEAGRPYEGAIAKGIVVEDREAGDDFFPELLDEIVAGQGTVAPKGADEADLIICDPGLVQLVQHVGNDGRGPGGPRDVVEDDADLLLAFGSDTDGLRSDGVENRLLDLLPVQRPPLVPGHVTELDLPAMGEGDVERTRVPPAELWQLDGLHLEGHSFGQRSSMRSSRPRYMS